MALQLTHELESGVSGNYWKINFISINRVLNSVYIDIALYKDSDARSAGKSPMMTLNYSLSGDDYDAFDSAAQDAEDENYVKTAYDKLKTHQDEFFSEATNV